MAAERKSKFEAEIVDSDYANPIVVKTVEDKYLGGKRVARPTARFALFPSNVKNQNRKLPMEESQQTLQELDDEDEPAGVHDDISS